MNELMKQVIKTIKALFFLLVLARALSRANALSKLNGVTPDNLTESKNILKNINTYTSVKI